MIPPPTTATLFQAMSSSLLGRVARSVVGGSTGGRGLVAVDGHAALDGVAAQHELDLGPDPSSVAPSPTTCSITRAPSSRSMTASGQRRLERGRHRVVDRRRCARHPWRAIGSSTNFDAAAADAVRVDRRRGVDRAAVDAAGAEQAEHLVGAAHELRALGRHRHRDRLAVGHRATPRARSTSAYVAARPPARMSPRPRGAGDRGRR